MPLSRRPGYRLREMPLSRRPSYRQREIHYYLGCWCRDRSG
jgi:hypothetical protein